MQKFYVVFLACFLISLPCKILAQSGADHWRIGYNYIINFNNSINNIPDTMSIPSKQTSKYIEASQQNIVSVSDKNGKFLFNIAQYNMQSQKTALGLFYDMFDDDKEIDISDTNFTGFVSSQQSFLVVPDVTTPNEYYIFYSCYPTIEGADYRKLYYSKVYADGIKYEIKVKNQELENIGNRSVALTAAYNKNCKDIWLMVFSGTLGTHDKCPGYLSIYSISSSGISFTNQYTWESGIIQDDNSCGIGIKCSPDCKQLALLNLYNPGCFTQINTSKPRTNYILNSSYDSLSLGKLTFFYFDNATGTIKYRGKYLYSIESAMYQFLQAGDFSADSKYFLALGYYGALDDHFPDIYYGWDDWHYISLDDNTELDNTSNKLPGLFCSFYPYRQTVVARGPDNCLYVGRIYSGKLEKVAPYAYGSTTINTSNFLYAPNNFFINQYAELDLQATNSEPCTGSDLNINSVITTTDTSYSLQWTGPNNFTSRERNITLKNVSPQMSGTYTLNVIMHGATLHKDINIYVNGKTAPKIISSASLFIDSTTLSLNQEYVNYKWSNGDTTKSIVAIDTGNYSVIVTNSNGCIDSASIVLSKPFSISISDTKFPEACPSAIVPLRFTIQNPNKYIIIIGKLSLKSGDVFSTNAYNLYKDKCILYSLESTQNILITFSPNDIGEFKDSLFIPILYPYPQIISKEFYGISKAYIKLYTPDISVIPGTDTCFNIFMKSTCCGTMQKKHLIFDINFDHNIFIPDSSNKDIINNTVKDGQQILTINKEITNWNDSLVLSIKGQFIRNSCNYSMIRFSNIETGSNYIMASATSGEIYVNNQSDVPDNKAYSNNIIKSVLQNNNNLNIEISNNFSGTVKCCLYDIRGTLLINKQVNYGTDNYGNINLNIANLPSGFYLLAIYTQNETATKPIEIIR